MPEFVKQWFISMCHRMKPKDVNGVKPTRFLNKDIAPTPLIRATFDTATFSAYWAVSGVSAASWAIGASALVSGLTVSEFFTAVLTCSCLIGLVSFLCGEPGVRYGVGFATMTRAAFGIYGSYVVLLAELLVNSVYFGIQAFWGGKAICVILNAITPAFMRITNTMPLGALIHTAELTGFILYLLIYFPILSIPPHRLKLFMCVAFTAIIMTNWGMLLWAIQTHKDVDKRKHPLEQPQEVLADSQRLFAFLQCVSGIGGTWVRIAFRQSDWTRFARSRNSSGYAQFFAAPLAITLTTLVGMVVTNQVRDRYGMQIWQPTDLLIYMQSMEYTTATRIGTFFAGLGWLMSQLSVNIINNSVGSGMDLSSLVPELINIRRGAVITAVLGIAANPWRLVHSPGTFTAVMSSFGTFTAPVAGILIADFWFVRKTCYNIPELYMAHSRYWYCHGFNYRSFMAWFLAVWPSMRFLAHVVEVDDSQYIWHYVFQISFVFGLLGGAFWYAVLSILFPLRGAAEGGTDGRASRVPRPPLEAAGRGDVSVRRSD